MVNQYYDIPRPLTRKCQDGSEAIRAFYNHLFIDSYGMTRGEVDLSFLAEMTSDELAITRELVRLNLRRGYTHLVEGTEKLRDTHAISILRELYEHQTDLSRRLTIAGSLWKLDRDHRFVDCVIEMVACDSNTLKEAHLDQVLWIGDARSIHLLIQLLDNDGRFVRSLALSRLNEIEHGKFFLGQFLPTSAAAYKIRSSDPDYVAFMVNRLGQLSLRNGG